ncbi:protease modulator HflC [Erythrobacter sp. HKB08]|uniref:protease modulator HflC n=1 Tax=Erythrobacter sp. HKB08 TaxID=2502843 RepID=UPI001008FA6C|nr:protease modulator HflC [Erythrobacter sp. HKB08]
MQTVWENHKLTIIAVVALIIAVLSTLFVVSEEEQVVILRGGEPVTVVNRFKPDQGFGSTGAGVWYRIPLLDNVVRIDKRVMDLEMTDQQVLSSDQQRLLVNAYARFRIIDPVRMVQRAQTTENLRRQLEPILNSVLRQELGRRTFQAMLTAERGTAMTNIRNNLDRQAREYGAQVIDVRIMRTDLPEGTPLESAFRRMETDREREAATIRAEGERDARIIRAEADASAARTYAQSFGQDPQFYDFYRAMQSYDATFAQREDGAESNFILSPDNEYLRQFRGRR